MANELDHLRLANSNQTLIDHLISENIFKDWLITVAFYKAVHVVEAVFAEDLNVHSSGHSGRERLLDIHTKYRSMHKDYSHLLQESRIARYLLAPPTRITIEEVKSKLIYKRLYGVEQNALQFLSAAGKALLVKKPARAQPQAAGRTKGASTLEGVLWEEG